MESISQNVNLENLDELYFLHHKKYKSWIKFKNTKEAEDFIKSRKDQTYKAEEYELKKYQEKICFLYKISFSYLNKDVI